MRVIQKQAKAAGKILGKQSGDPNRKLRLLTYCGTAHCDEGILLYNVMTKEMLLLENDELSDRAEEGLEWGQLDPSGELYSYLFEHWFLVPENCDDKELCLNLRALAQRMLRFNSPKGFSHYTILPTTDCNARCFYCYEAGTKRRNMTRETALRVVDFICENWESVKRTERPGYQVRQIDLSWFGGEPLYNSEVIDLITSELARREVPYRSGMITNGYLFDEGIIQRAVEQWKLTSLQITLDGTEEIYNRTKAYLENEGSAFVRVTDNIRRLLDVGIAVSIRLNLDDRNDEDLKVLIEWLTEHFGDYKKFHAYVAYVYRLNDGMFNEPFRGDVRTLCEELLILQARLRDLGISSRNRLRRTVKTNNCMADDDASVVIQTDGSLGRCEHYYDSMPCGSIKTGITDSKLVDWWKQTDADAEVCEDCPVYPDCYRLTGCGSAHIAACQQVPAMREDIRPSLQRDMLSCYNKVKKENDRDGQEAE